jgi:hypothetical protein
LFDDDDDDDAFLEDLVEDDDEELADANMKLSGLTSWNK